jgi:GNAT superfamily N-acetyltransferase
MSKPIHIKRVTGADLDDHIGELARLRIQVFRDYPYLYDGDLDYEAHYLRTYSQARGSVIVLALDVARVVGAATAVPLREETEAVQAPFIEQGYDPADVFYLGESVLLPEYRGQGIGVRFFEEREAHARALGPLRWFAFCAVERPAEDQRRPPNYRPLDRFWRNRGYRRHPVLRTAFSWKEIGESAESLKPMVFWLKAA